MASWMWKRRVKDSPGWMGQLVRSQPAAEPPSAWAPPHSNPCRRFEPIPSHGSAKAELMPV